MGTTALRQLFKTFCTNLSWNYAVFWKLSHQAQMVLSWEDGFFDFPKPVKVLSEDIYCTGTDEIISSHCETSVQDGDYGGYSIGLAVASMSTLHYTLGEGVVGKVANTGNHLWFSNDNVSSSKINSNLVPKCPEEWLPQLASGIKTILLVPVLPHGVLQLGSLKMVVEDQSLVAYIKDRFMFHNTGRNIIPSTLGRDIQTQSSSALVSGIVDSLDKPSDSTFCPAKSEGSDTVEIGEPNKDLLSTFDQFVPLLNFHDALQVSEDLSGTFISETKPLVGFNKESESSGYCIDAGEIELAESKLFGLSCLEEELQLYSSYNKYDEEVFGELYSYSGALNSYTAGDTMEQLFENEILNNTINNSLADFLSFPEDCELHKALGPTFERHTNEYLWNSSSSVHNSCSSSSLVSNGNLSDGFEPSCFAKEGDTEYLLDAVVANVCGDLDNTSDVSNSINSSLTSLGQFVSSLQPQSEYEASVLIGDDLVSRRHFTSSCNAGERNESSPTSTTIKSTMSTVIDKEKLEKDSKFMQPEKESQPSTVNQKRAKPGSNQRPRPRDRQLIQDRLKELRDLVPDGLKCSIDGLLDRTIKHMLYLRSVTDQAEKLRQWVYNERGVRKNLRSSEASDGNQNGTTWAFELGNEFLVFPIVVEDLACPGQMLIEMLCDEHYLFLEIAQVIRSSQLTILKGVMENRSNNTWAHFIVEASKGFHRMDIFWPLMQLMQRKTNSISSKI
ncbi:transcription factor LHW-like [Mangifera indica]|uniref:transcription factor LHW-like n=1 Tax=Mangifera indica TaxID=29780 RepID=UPI001CFA9BAB|nr:transcription factor LHW-like [Mangifera indica]